MNMFKKLGLGLIPVFCLSFPLQGFAHAHLVKSEPAKAAIVKITPETITLHFSETLEIAMCKLEVKNQKTNEVVSTGKPTTPDSQSLQIGLTPAKVEKASYQVNWKVVAKDAHKMQGSFEFTVDPGTK